MEKQQTAVEWLKQKWYSDENDITDETFEQAREIEKEQIMDAYKEGHYHLDFDSFNPEQYYNETFKTE